MTIKKRETESEIYLGKAQKIYGPFSSSELDEMATSGKLGTFVWIWDHKAEHWKPLENPPAPPNNTTKNSDQVSEWLTEAALCYDQFSTVSGTLEAITETGCILKSDHLGAAPKFAIRSNVAVSRLDAKRKKTKRTEARVIGVARDQSHWAYKLRWTTSN